MDSLAKNFILNGGKTLILPISPFNPTPKPPFHSPNLHFSLRKTSKSSPRFRVSATFNPDSKKFPILRKLKSTTGAVILTATAAFLVGKFSTLPARAESPATVIEEKLETESAQEGSEKSALSQFLESHSEAVDGLKSLLQRKLEDGEDAEALNILRRLVESQPSNLEWKFLMARLLNEIGETMEARKVFEEILEENPLSFEALFENALLMDRCGEGEEVLRRLEKALEIAKNEEKEEEARDVRFIMAQIQYLQKNIDEALKSYDELAAEDPKDYRPYFCKGAIYSFLDRNKEAREEFVKYRELSPRKFEVEGFLQTPLSRMKLFGTDSDN